jgi:FSR family fosmidomycin resistance protein-like MFS transporter
VVSFFHFVLDSYASLFSPLMALARMDAARIGVLAMLYSASTSFSQLAFGYFSDRFGLRRFAALGLAAATIALSVAGLVIDAPVALGAALVVGGLGVAAFHPAGVVLAARALPQRPTVGVSVFITTGTAGFALAPLVYVLFVEHFGLESSGWLVLPGLLALPFVYFLPRSALESRPPPGPARRRVLTFLSEHGAALLPIYLLVVVRSGVQISLTSFVPTVMIQRGHPDVAAGLSAMCFSGGGALGMLVWGFLAGRYDRRWLQIASVVLGTPISLLFLYADSIPLALSLALLTLTGFFVLATNTMHIVMGQELSPRNASTISSIVMGMGWGVGSAGPAVVGALSRSWSLETSLAAVCLVPLLTLPLALFLRARPATESDPGTAAEAASSAEAAQS